MAEVAPVVQPADPMESRQAVLTLRANRTYLILRMPTTLLRVAGTGAPAPARKRRRCLNLASLIRRLLVLGPPFR